VYSTRISARSKFRRSIVIFERRRYLEIPNKPKFHIPWSIDEIDRAAASRDPKFISKEIKMQTTNRKHPFGMPLYAFVLILVLVLTSAGVIAGHYLDLNVPSIFSGNQPKTTTSRQPSNPSVLPSVQQVPFESNNLLEHKEWAQNNSIQQVSARPNILVENRDWSRHSSVQPASFKTNALVENKEWARHAYTQQSPFQTNILVENREWGR
jgi:hypothetical protein